MPRQKNHNLTSPEPLFYRDIQSTESYHHFPGQPTVPYFGRYCEVFSANNYYSFDLRDPSNFNSIGCHTVMFITSVIVRNFLQPKFFTTYRLYFVTFAYCDTVTSFPWYKSKFRNIRSCWPQKCLLCLARYCQACF